ncbi:glycerophosphodiester phosphodiesterase family protein [Acidobacteriota bacterium]
MKSKAKRTDLDWLLASPIAHRGFYDNASNYPENSLASFERAIKSGYPIELDVRLLKDSDVVVFHDEDLERMTKHQDLIKDCDSDQIRQIKLLESHQTIPLLSEVLDTVAGQVPLIIEVKNEDHRVGPLEMALWQRLSSYKGKYAIVSFNPFTLKWFSKNAPEVIRGQLSSDFHGEDLPFYTKFLLRNLFMNSVSKPDFVLYDIRCLPYWAATRVKKKGLPLLGWTATNQEDHIKATKFCDNVIFEGYQP